MMNDKHYIVKTEVGYVGRTGLSSLMSRGQDRQFAYVWDWATATEMAALYEGVVEAL